MSDDLLLRAKQHVFMAGVDDSGARLCEANACFGVAKIQHVQKRLGLPQDATFVGSPDATITRNNPRWKQGFGYGGVYEWSGEFAVLDIKPNACGMLTGSLPNHPELETVRSRLHDLSREGLSLDGVELDNDLTESNHFVDVFEVDDEGSTEPVPGGNRHVFIMHSSGHEHRDNTDRGVGLYWDQSDELLAMARVLETPWGVLRILVGERATEWFEFYKQVQDFNHRRREALARYLFGDFDVVVNATHQGMVRAYNCNNIGCYTFEDPQDGELPLFPLTLSPTLPAFLVRGSKNFTDDAIGELGWRQRIETHDLFDKIAGTNLLPHGGGYLYPNIEGVARVLQKGPDNRRFVLISKNPHDTADIIETPRGLPYGYRGMEVKDRMESLGLGRATTKLDLKYVLEE